MPEIPEIQYQHIPGMTAVSARLNLKQRADLYPALVNLRARIPAEAIDGLPFGIVHFITTVREGIDLEIGFPLRQPLSPAFETRTLPPYEALTLVHKGPIEQLGESFQKLFAFANRHAVISDEVAREVYHLPIRESGEGHIELQFIIHNWSALLEKNLMRVLGPEAQAAVMQGAAQIGLCASIKQRFTWVQGVIERLDEMADRDQRYEILSRCAHKFPQEHIDRLRAAFLAARAQTDDPLEAVDAALAFMDADPVWRKPPVRKGRVIYATKNPRDAKGYAEANTEAERRRAYCFCPLIRDHLDAGLSPSFCNCSAGWERQQWEGALGVQLRVEVVESLLRGDERCRFAIHLPEEF